MDIIDKIKAGEKRAIARAISYIENDTQEGHKILDDIKRVNTKVDSYIIGITGPPGAGKSTLVNQIAKRISKNGKTVGIIAVDPSSPITGGALLGDRIRMGELTLDENIFIRSMATRGALGGLSKAVGGAVLIYSLCGMKYIIIETVGVGQSEVDIMNIADIVAFVTVPGLGDDIQIEKAGIIEIADVIVLNKCERDDTDITYRYLSEMVNMIPHKEEPDSIVKIIKTEALKGQGIDELLEVLLDGK